MAADTFELKSYTNTPAIFAASYPGVIERSFDIDIDTPIGANGSAGCNPLETNDVLRFFKLPPHAKISYGRIDAEALDSGAALTLTLRVTDGTTTKTLINATTVARAGGFVDTRDAGGNGIAAAYTNTALGFQTTNSSFRVEVLAAAGAAGAGAGDQMRVTIGYVMNLESGEYA